MTAEWIWMNGEFVKCVRMPPMSMSSTHALHYGSSVFEGIRAYSYAAGTGSISVCQSITLSA